MSKRKDSRAWQHMQLSVRQASPQMIEMAKTDPVIAALLEEAREMWGNPTYSATVRRRNDGTVESIGVHRRDRRPLRDWRDMYHIKTDIAGPDAEAVELYPAADRLMDTANEYWLWVYPPGERLPIGFDMPRTVTGSEEADRFGAVQREPDYADDEVPKEAPKHVHSYVLPCNVMCPAHPNTVKKDA